MLAMPPAPKASSADKFKGKPPLWATVTATVYELHNFGAVRRLVGRIDHVGIEVFGVEWSYGANDCGSGVFPCRPGECPLGTLSQRVNLGVTPYTPPGVIKLLEELRPLWPGPDYALLEKNCQHFSMEFARRLHCNPLPEWVTHSLARYGTMAANESSPVAMPYLHHDMEDLQEMVEDETQDIATRYEIQGEIVFRLAVKHMAERAEASETAARFADYSLEMVHPGDAAAVRTFDELSRRIEFRQAVLDATAHALACGTNVKNETDWIEILHLARVAGNCLAVRLRRHSAPNAPKDWPPRPPKLEEFERLFLRSLQEKIRGKDRKTWPAGTMNVLGSLQVRTAPGMCSFGERVEEGRGGGGAVVFGRSPAVSDKKNTPEDTLSRVRANVGSHLRKTFTAVSGRNRRHGR